MNKKTTIALLLISGLSMLLGSHSTHADDYEYSYNSGLNTQCVTKSEDGYYIKLGGILYFADDSLDNVFPLCSKPECLHGEEPNIVGRSNCDAFVGDSDVTAIQSYNEELFTASTWDLNQKRPFTDFQHFYKISADGRLKEDLELEDGILMTPIVHKNHIYYFTQTYQKGERGKVYINVTLYKQELSGKEREILWQSDEGVDGFTGLKAYGDYLYFGCGTSEWFNEFVFTLSDGGYSILAPFGDEGFGYTFADGKLLLSRRDITRDCVENQTVYVADLDGENVEALVTLSPEDDDCVFSILGDYLVSDNVLTWAVHSGEEHRTIRLYDRDNYSLAAEIDVEDGLENGETARIGQCFGDEHFLFFATMTEEYRQNIRYIDLTKVSDGDTSTHLLATTSDYSRGYTIEADGTIIPH